MNEAFKAPADPTRRNILRELRKGERSAGELAELFPLAKSTLSGHFSVLKATDLVDREARKRRHTRNAVDLGAFLPRLA